MPRRFGTLFASIVIGLLAAITVLLIPRRVAEPPRPLAKPTYLSERERQEVHRHMNHHGADMIELSWDVVLLDDEATAQRAERIAGEPSVAPSGLPARFYSLQDEMLASAVRLGQAARAHDSAAIARDYGQLAGTCVACHRVYLQR